MNRSKIDQKTGKHEDYDYVDVKDVPKILYQTFLSQPDEQRIEIAELIAKLDHDQNKPITLIQYLVK